jgi:hypothetical protein
MLYSTNFIAKRFNLSNNNGRDVAVAMNWSLGNQSSIVVSLLGFQVTSPPLDSWRFVGGSHSEMMNGEREEIWDEQDAA